MLSAKRRPRARLRTAAGVGPSALVRPGDKLLQRQLRVRQLVPHPQRRSPGHLAVDKAAGQGAAQSATASAARVIVASAVRKLARSPAVSGAMS